MSNPVLSAGSPVSATTVSDQTGSPIHLSDFKGEWVVLYTYPKDMTPGCTIEAHDFSTLAPQFQKEGATVLGLSADSAERHCKFIDKESLSLRLLSDPEHKLIEALGAWQLKTFMGRKAMGIVRSTWIVDPSGKVAASWSPVKVTGHAAEVLQRLRELRHKP